MRKNVAVLIPAVNEEGTVGKVIHRIKEIYSDTEDYTIEVIVVNDGSTDNTVREVESEGVNKIVHHAFKRGLGAATRSGMNAALEMGADIAVKIDADFQHLPEDIDKVVRPILDGRADVVFGSRFLGGLKYRMPWGRKVGNTFFTFLTNRLTGLRITDAQTGLMAFSSKYLRIFNLNGDYNETQQLIIDSWGKHMRLLEVSVTFQQRTTGRSFISLKYPFKVLPTLLRLLVQVAPLKVFVPVGVIFVLLGIAAGIAVLLDFAPRFVGDVTVAILTMGGLQTVMFGLLADAIVKRK